MAVPTRLTLCFAMLGLAVGMTSTNVSARAHRLAATCSSSREVRDIRVKTARRSSAFHCQHCLRSCSRYRWRHSVMHVVRTKHHAHRASATRIRPAVSAVTQIVEPASGVASFEYFRAINPDSWSATDGEPVVVRARTYSVEQNIASNVAIADQTDGAARLMLMSAAAPPPVSITGWYASPRESEDVAIVKY